jgi:hypothetical protein
MDENKADDDKRPSEKHGFLHGNAANEPKLTRIGAHVQPKIEDSSDYPDEKLVSDIRTQGRGDWHREA